LIDSLTLASAFSRVAFSPGLAQSWPLPSANRFAHKLAKKQARLQALQF
jgi:hypothetical protein